MSHVSEKVHAGADVIPMSGFRLPDWRLVAGVAALIFILAELADYFFTEDIPDCENSGGHIMAHHTTYDFTTKTLTRVLTCIRGCGYTVTEVETF